MRLKILTSILLLQCSLSYASVPVPPVPIQNFALTLDQHLQSKGFFLTPLDSKINEGYINATQQEQFRQQLALYPHIKTIVEIGLNAGHSAENFFQLCKNIEKFVSIDINIHPYTKHAVEYLQAKYKNRFIFIPGNSKVRVPELAQLSRQKKDRFDLIYIDGDHSYDGCRIDIENCKKLAHKDTILWIDDCKNRTISRAINRCEKRKIIRVTSTHVSLDQDGERSWVQARYIYKKAQKKL